MMTTYYYIRLYATVFSIITFVLSYPVYNNQTICQQGFYNLIAQIIHCCLQNNQVQLPFWTNGMTETVSYN